MNKERYEHIITSQICLARVQLAEPSRCKEQERPAWFGEDKLYVYSSKKKEAKIAVCVDRTHDLSIFSATLSQLS